VRDDAIRSVGNTRAAEAISFPETGHHSPAPAWGYPGAAPGGV